MKNVENWASRPDNASFEKQVAVAQRLLRNTRDLRACDLTAQHYDLMLQLKAIPDRGYRTLPRLASRLGTDLLTCNAALELLRQRNLVRTRRSGPAQPATSQLTAKGEALLRRLSRRDHDRWLDLAPSLLASLSSAIAEEDCDDFSQDSLC